MFLCTPSKTSLPPSEEGSPLTVERRVTVKQCDPAVSTCPHQFCSLLKNSFRLSRFLQRPLRMTLWVRNFLSPPKCPNYVSIFVFLLLSGFSLGYKKDFYFSNQQQKLTTGFVCSFFLCFWLFFHVIFNSFYLPIWPCCIFKSQPSFFAAHTWLRVFLDPFPCSVLSFSWVETFSWSACSE